MFSIIMPAYNASENIADAIQSILNQSYSKFELIIIDDKSSDNTVEVIQSFCDPRIQLIALEKNSGVANARNKGIEQAKYPYIGFLDSDDLYHPKHLEIYLQYFEKGHDVLYSYYERLSFQHKK